MVSRSKNQRFRQRSLKQRPLTQRPFAGLDRILSQKAIQLADGQLSDATEWIRRARRPADPMSPADERRLFKKAMTDVRPLKANIRADTGPPITHTAGSPSENASETSENASEGTAEDVEGLRQLRELVEHGKGFTLAYTAEYMAGPDGHGIDPLSQALHQGRYAIQDYIDLHGMGVAEAEAALQRFFKRSVAMGLQGVLIVHGRGLRSERAPVLKKRVSHWLTRGPWRRWVAAFASAQAVDGGTGATYVLIRKAPGKKRRRQNHF